MRASSDSNYSPYCEKGDDIVRMYGYEFRSEGGHTVVYDETGKRVCDAESIDEAIRDMKEDEEI